jgi:hypothetical protein
MIFESNSSGIDRLLASIRKAQTELPRITQEGAQRAGDTLKQQLSSAAPRGKSSGGPPPAGDASGPLAGSFNAKAEQQGAGATLELTTNQPLKLKYVTLGTGIYVGKGVIRPLTKKALFWPGAAHPYRSVKGIKGKDFVKPVLSKAPDVVKAEMQKAIQEMRAILGG